MHAILVFALLASTPLWAKTSPSWRWTRDLLESGVEGQLVEPSDPVWQTHMPEHTHMFLARPFSGRVLGVGIWKNLDRVFMNRLKQMQGEFGLNVAFTADKTSRATVFNAAAFSPEEVVADLSPNARPVLFITPAANLLSLAHEERHLRDEAEKYTEETWRRILALGISDFERAAPLFNLVSEARAYVVSQDPRMSSGELFDSFYAEYLKPFHKVLAELSPEAAEGARELARVAMADFEANEMSEWIRENLSPNCGAKLKNVKP